MTKLLFQTSTIKDGNMSLRFGDGDVVVENRTHFLAKHGVDWNEHVCMRCDHGLHIALVGTHTKTDTYRMIDAEVLITQEKGLALMLLTADCLPTLFFDPVTETVALAHLSRKTIADELPIQTVAYLRDQLAIDPQNLLVSAGPHIHKDSYAFPLPQPALPDTLAPHTHTTQTHRYIDLPAACTAQLASVGVPKKQIHYAPIDTATSAEHFSHYKTTLEGAAAGRMVTIAMLS